MRFQMRSKHIIDLIFPIALLFVFATSSLVVLILAANIYASTTNQIQANDQNRTSLSYISQKMRQSDQNGGISVEDFEGVSCLTIRSTLDDKVYITYIYEYDGKLKELFINDGAKVSLESGKDIMDIDSLSMQEKENGLFTFHSTDKKGNEDSLIISERSMP